MADTKLDIILRLKDELSKGIDGANRKIDSFAHGLNSAGRSISQFSNKLAIAGTAMTAPFVVALKSVEKYSYGVQTELAKTNNTWLQFNNTIAQAALPTVREFNSAFAKLVNFFNSINPKTLEQIAHWTLVTGAVLLAGAAFGKLLGTFMQMGAKIIQFIRWFGWWNIAIIAIVAAVAGLIYAWNKFHDQFLTVIDAVELVFLTAIDNILLAWQNFLDAITLFKNAPSWTEGLPFVRDLKTLGMALDGASTKIKGYRADIQSEISKLGQGHGALATGIDTMVGNAGNAVQGLVDKWKNASDEIGTMMVDMTSRWHDLAMNFADGFGDAFDRVLFEGQRFKESMKSLFQQMARDIVKDFVKTGFKNILNKLFFPEAQVEGGQGVGGGLANMVLGLFNPVKQASNSTASSMNNASNKTTQLANTLGFGTNALGGFFNSLTSFGSSLMGVAGSLIQGIGGLLGSIGGGLGGLLGGIGGGIGGGFMSVLGTIGGLFAFFHQGGLVRPIFAHSGLAPDEVPIVAQTGEGVLSRRGMRALGGSDNLRRLNSGMGVGGGGGTTVVINQMIQAWDAQDVYRNRRVLSAALAHEIQTNGNLRKVMKEN